MATTHTLVVFTNAADGRDDEYNDWHSNIHVPDAFKIPGFRSAQRYVLSDYQRREGPFPWRYLAIYDIETDDIARTMDELGAIIGTDAMVMSDSLGDPRLSWMFEPYGPRQNSTIPSGLE